MVGGTIVTTASTGTCVISTNATCTVGGVQCTSEQRKQCQREVVDLFLTNSAGNPIGCQTDLSKKNVGQCLAEGKCDGIKWCNKTVGDNDIHMDFSRNTCSNSTPGQCRLTFVGANITNIAGKEVCGDCLKTACDKNFGKGKCPSCEFVDNVLLCQNATGYTIDSKKTQ